LDEDYMDGHHYGEDAIDDAFWSIDSIRENFSHSNIASL
jgi:hypothetical protein